MNNRFIEAIARRIAETTPEFKWLKDFFSTTIQRNANVITRGTNTSQGNLAEWGANGDLTDSGHSTNQDLETTSDVKFRSVEAARIDVNRNLTFKRENTAGTTSSAKSGIMLTGLTSPMIDVPSGADFGFIDSQYFKDGAIIFLKFNGNSTITHKENGAEADNVRLNHNETHTFTNKDFLTLQYDDVVKEWREIGRSSKKPVNGSFVGDSDTQTLTNKTIDGNNNTLQNFATQNLTWATNMDGQGLDFLNGGDPDKATQSSPVQASVAQTVLSNSQGQLKLVIQHEGDLSSTPVDIEMFINGNVQTFTVDTLPVAYAPGGGKILTFNQNFNDKDTLAFRTKSPNNSNASNMGRTIVNAYIY